MNSAHAAMETDVSGHEATRRRQVELMASMMPEQIARTAWSRERIEAERTRELRTLLRHAVSSSPWYRDRLRGIDLETVTADTIDRLPVMTKDDLMANWDAIVADPRATLAAAEAHLDDLGPRLTYFLDEYVVVASGGSSGVRGVFLWDFRGWATAWAGVNRGLVLVARTLGLDGLKGTVAAVAAAAPSHASAALAQTFTNPELTVARFSPMMPLDELVDGLNQAAPQFLQSYSSILPALAAEAEAGRLRIAPRFVLATSEPLLPEMREAAERAWNAPVLNGWVTSESVATCFHCGVGDGFHLGDDLNVIELVDEAGRAVAPGTRSDRIFLTNLYNRVLPLVRYEITDQLTASPEPCRCGSAHVKIGDVDGRADEVFRYGSLAVHPIAFRSPLGREAAIVEYQVRQTPSGAEVDVVTRAPVDLEALGAKIRGSLERLGLRAPEVCLRSVASIARQATGKLKRFVPLRAT